MPMEYEVPEWENGGTRPSDTAIQEGWKEEEKPPADWFNWFFNRTSLGLAYLKQHSLTAEEIQEKINNVTVPDASATVKGITKVVWDYSQIPDGGESFATAASVVLVQRLQTILDTTLRVPSGTYDPIVDMNTGTSLKSGIYTFNQNGNIPNLPSGLIQGNSYILAVQNYSSGIIRQWIFDTTKTGTVYRRTLFYTRGKVTSEKGWVRETDKEYVDTQTATIRDNINTIFNDALQYREDMFSSFNQYVARGIYYIENLSQITDRPTAINGSPIAQANAQLIVYEYYDLSGIQILHVAPYSDAGTSTSYFRWFTISGGVYKFEAWSIMAKMTTVGNFAVPGTLNVTKDSTFQSSLNVLNTLTVGAYIKEPLLRGGVSASLAADNQNSKRWTFHISDGDNGTLYLSPSKTAQAADWDFNKGINIRPSDGKMANNGRILLDEIDAVKQSGVDRKNQLVSAIIANGGSASTSEDMSALINKLAAISNRRYKEGTTSTNTNGGGNNPVSWIFPAGFYDRIRTDYYPFESATQLVAIQTNTQYNAYVELYAQDGAGRQLYVGRIPTATSGVAYWYISKVIISQSQIQVAGFRGAGGTNSPLSLSVNVSGGFDMSTGVRLVFNKINPSNGYPNITPTDTLVFGG